MTQYQRGDIIYVNLNLSKGVETQNVRPCVVVSNNQYNKYLNTIIVAPISSSEKHNKPYYKNSPLFVTVPQNKIVTGTILLQHLRSIDPSARIDGDVLYQLPQAVIADISKSIAHFF